MNAATPTERQIQRAIKALCDMRGIECWHIPNGGSRHPVEARNLKLDGATAGAPDLIIWLPRGRVGCMEVKTRTGRQSGAQIEVQQRLEALGHRYEVVRSLTEAEGIINAWERI